MPERADQVAAKSSIPGERAFTFASRLNSNWAGKPWRA